MKIAGDLVGRSAELTEIDALLADARAGRSRTLLLHGDAGIGKTALLNAASARARGFNQLRSVGNSYESEVAFSGLHDLLRPVLPGRSRLPKPQAQALGAVFALEEGAVRDPFVVSLAAFGLLTVAATRGPLFVAVDDLQWMDAASREALLFASRHLANEGIAMVLTARNDDRDLDTTGIPKLGLGGLDERAAKNLLEQSGPSMDLRVQGELIAMAEGNPLALLEFRDALTPAQISGDEPIHDLLPMSPDLESAFARQIVSLSSDSRKALLIAAMLGTGQPSILSTALEHAGLAPAAFHETITKGIVEASSPDEIVFRHPLLRTCVYQAASPAERHEAHRVLARALENSSDPEARARRAWHLAAAVSPPDEGVAHALELAGLESRRRLGHVAAFQAFKRAAEFSGDGESQARRLLEAAREADRAGQPNRALEVLDRATALTDDGEIRVESLHLQGRIAMWVGGPLAAQQSLLRSAAEIASFDADRATLMAAEAVGAAFMAGNAAAIRGASTRATQYAEEAGPASALAAQVAGLEVAILLDASTDAAAQLRDYIDVLLQEPVLQTAHQVVGFLGVTMIYVEDHANAHHVLTTLVQSARDTGALSVLPYPLSGLAELHFRSGDWMSALAAGLEAAQVAEETNLFSNLSYVLSVVARIEAALGRTRDALVHLERSDQLRRQHAVDSVELYATEARGCLEMSLARWDRAVAPLERTRDIARTHGVLEPGVVQWAPNLAEVYARLGRQREANALLSELETVALKVDRAWCLGAIERCRGILTTGVEADHHFGTALDHHARSLLPFETARTQLAYAEKLFEIGRRGDGVVQLDAARATFRRLGARPWLEQAHRLDPTPGVPNEDSRDLMTALTPQEVQVASAVSGGATNKEVAAALFVSVKTIEAHLGSIYRKLGLRSRTELAVLVAGA